MKCLFSILLIALMFVSCEKVTCEKEYDKSWEGIYQGTFQRQTGGTGAISNVSITMAPDDFVGYSSEVKYPAICKGTFSVTGSKISFQNSCVWTADFDGTLILTGEYDLDVSGDSLVFHRDYNGVIFSRDIYRLKKQ
jgi:hypothetical protein